MRLELDRSSPLILAKDEFKSVFINPKKGVVVGQEVERPVVDPQIVKLRP